MFFDLNGTRAHALTGGSPFDPELPTVVFLHGAGMDATVWALQTRWFAHHGFAVLALDLPGHGRSEGSPLSTIEAMSDWVSDALGALAAPPAAIVGHSMGSLVAQALAAHHPAQVSRLGLIGTALAMRVGPDLQKAADEGDFDAVAMVNLWGHGPRAGLGHAETPGIWMAGSGQRLLERAKRGVLASDLRACNTFDVEPLLAAIQAPVLILQGARDMMTPLKAAQALSRGLPDAAIRIYPGGGHMLMVEEAGAVLTDLAAAFGRGAKTISATRPVGAPP